MGHWLSLKRFFHNPIHVKEFRERFRMRNTVWLLSAYLAVTGAMLLGFMYLSLHDTSGFVPGQTREYFIAFSALQLIMIAFIAPALAAGAISGERERQTLHVLLTTLLSPLSIVLSKLISSLSFTAFLVFTSLPLYSFIFLFGGISPLEVAQIFLFFAVNILFYGCMGLFCSTFIKRTGLSTVTAYGILFLSIIGTGLLGVFIMRWREIERFNTHSWLTDLVMSDSVLHVASFLFTINPAYAFLTIFDGQIYDDLPGAGWGGYSVIYGLLSVVLILWSAYLLQSVRHGKVE
jgi:ABC-2 type transport system permease protein